MHTPSPATVAIVGRPNVGKSALFNRLIGRRLAIVEDTPGVTRDRLYGLCEWRGRTFTLVDTAGIDPGATEASDSIGAVTRRQAEAAAAQADAVLFVVDAADGRMPLDEDVAQILRRTRRPVILAANKAESSRAADAADAEFATLGFGRPVAVSAIHGEGTGDLLDSVLERLPADAQASADEGELSLALIGRPNVGKSSLLNALLGEERALVSEIAGTTRDTIEESITVQGVQMRLIDTAGIREHADRLEAAGIERTQRALAGARVALLVIDGSQPLGAEARALLEQTAQRARVVFANKADLGGAGEQQLNGIAHVRGSVRDRGTLEGLREALAREAWGGEFPDLERPHLASLAELNAVALAIEALGQAMHAIDADDPIDVIAPELQRAFAALGQLTGDAATEELLTGIFARFCIGK